MTDPRKKLGEARRDLKALELAGYRESALLALQRQADLTTPGDGPYMAAENDMGTGWGVWFDNKDAGLPGQRFAPTFRLDYAEEDEGEDEEVVVSRVKRMATAVCAALNWVSSLPATPVSEGGERGAAGQPVVSGALPQQQARGLHDRRRFTSRTCGRGRAGSAATSSRPHGRLTDE